MSRRGGASIKLISVVVVGLIGLYAFYSYHDLHTRLKTSDEKLSRVSQQHDSVSAQLQGGICFTFDEVIIFNDSM